MGGATIIPRILKTMRNEKFFEIGKKIFFFIYEPFMSGGGNSVTEEL
jgi:hypothetical protein